MLRRTYKIIEVEEDCDHSGYFIEETVCLWRWKLYIRFLQDGDTEEACTAFPTFLAAQNEVSKRSGRK